MKIGFIGAGKMAQALARGLINSGRITPENIIASCPKQDAVFLEQCKTLGLGTTHDNTEVVHKSDVIFLAVKPPHVSKVASEIAPIFSREQLLISIALGITIRNIESLLPTKSRVVRVMPNTPAVVRAGASAYAMGSACRDGDAEIVKDMLSTVGFAVEVPEVHIDPVTGLSGSGPSYMFAAIEGLADGGVKVGLPRDLALKLAAHTLLGAAKMVLETGTHPAQLKDDVQSPAGSSVYGMHKLESGGLKGILMDAVEAATNRSRATGDKALPRDLRNQEFGVEKKDDERQEVYQGRKEREQMHVAIMNKELALRVILKGEARIKQLEEEKAENEALVQKLIEKIQYASRLAEIDDVTGMADQRVNSDGEQDPATGQIEEVKRLEAGMAEKDVVIERLTRENVELEEEKTRNKVEIQKLLEENDKCYETLKKAQNVIAKMMPYVEKGVATTEAGQQEELVPAEDNTAYVKQIKKLAGKETKMKAVIERLTEEKQELADRLECSELAKALVDQKMASETAQQELGQAQIRGLTSMVQEHKEEKEAWKVEEKLESSASSEQSKDLPGRPEETEENIQEAALEHSWKELELDTYSMPCEDLDEFDLDEEAVDWEDCETNW